MSLISVVATELLAEPLPVLFLDTCELLAAMQSLSQERVEHINALRLVDDALMDTPPRVVVVVTDLVKHEWRQNYLQVQEKSREFLTQADKLSQTVHQAWVNLKKPAPVASAHATSPLLSELTVLAESVQTHARILDHDQGCVNRAYQRVLTKSKPSDDGHIKDSVHLEHYLELARQLQAGGFAKRRVFVSSNKKDFWDAPKGGRLHSSLVAEFGSVGLEFFGELHAAVGSMRI